AEGGSEVRDPVDPGIARTSQDPEHAAGAQGAEGHDARRRAARQAQARSAAATGVAAAGAAATGDAAASDAAASAAAADNAGEVAEKTDLTGVPPGPTAASASARGMRASEIMAAIPTDDWTMTPDASQPTVLPQPDKPPVVIESAKPVQGPPTGDWTITNDPR